MPIGINRGGAEVRLCANQRGLPACRDWYRPCSRPRRRRTSRRQRPQEPTVMNFNLVLALGLVLSSFSLGGCVAQAGDDLDRTEESAEAQCTPDCTGRTCGLDPVCGTSCGTCGSGQTCDQD